MIFYLLVCFTTTEEVEIAKLYYSGIPITKRYYVQRFYLDIVNKYVLLSYETDYQKKIFIGYTNNKFHLFVLDMSIFKSDEIVPIRR